MWGEGWSVCPQIQSHSHNTHRHPIFIFKKRLSPEFYDNIIRLPIPISNIILMMIRVLPMHPSPHGLIRSLVVGGWDRGLGRVAYTMPR